MIRFVGTKGERMEERDETACAWYGEQVEEYDDTACV